MSLANIGSPGNNILTATIIDPGSTTRHTITNLIQTPLSTIGIATVTSAPPPPLSTVTTRQTLFRDNSTPGTELTIAIPRSTSTVTTTLYTGGSGVMESIYFILPHDAEVVDRGSGDTVTLHAGSQIYPVIGRYVAAKKLNSAGALNLRGGAFVGIDNGLARAPVPELWLTRHDLGLTRTDFRMSPRRFLSTVGGVTLTSQVLRGRVVDDTRTNAFANPFTMYVTVTNTGPPATTVTMGTLTAYMDDLFVDQYGHYTLGTSPRRFNDLFAHRVGMGEWSGAFSGPWIGVRGPVTVTAAGATTTTSVDIGLHDHLRYFTQLHSLGGPTAIGGLGPDEHFVNAFNFDTICVFDVCAWQTDHFENATPYISPGNTFVRREVLEDHIFPTETNPFNIRNYELTFTYGNGLTIGAPIFILGRNNWVYFTVAAGTTLHGKVGDTYLATLGAGVHTLTNEDLLRPRFSRAGTYREEGIRYLALQDTPNPAHYQTGTSRRGLSGRGEYSDIAPTTPWPYPGTTITIGDHTHYQPLRFPYNIKIPRGTAISVKQYRQGVLPPAHDADNYFEFPPAPARR